MTAGKSPVLATSPQLYPFKLRQLSARANKDGGRLIFTGDYLGAPGLGQRMAVVREAVRDGAKALACRSDAVFVGAVYGSLLCEKAWKGADYNLDQELPAPHFPLNIFSLRALQAVFGKKPFDPRFRQFDEFISSANWLSLNLQFGLADGLGNYHTTADLLRLFGRLYGGKGLTTEIIDGLFGNFKANSLSPELSRILLASLLTADRGLISHLTGKKDPAAFCAGICAALGVERIVIYRVRDLGLDRFRQVIALTGGRLILVPENITKTGPGKGGCARFDASGFELFSYKPGVNCDFASFAKYGY